MDNLTHVRRFCTAGLLAGLLVAISACGGLSLFGGKLASGLIESGPGATAVRPGKGVQQYALPEAGAGIRQKLTYSYDYSAFPAVAGFTAVPLTPGFELDQARAGAYITTVEEGANSRLVKVACQQAPEPLLHIRYDKHEWEPESIGVKNPFPGVKDFVQLSQVVQPGLIEVVALPAGEAARTASRVGNGGFLEISFVRPRAPRALSSVPDGTPTWTTSFYSTGLSGMISYGNSHFVHDGTVGSTQHGDDLIDNAEHSALMQDQYAYDSNLPNLGRRFGWDDSGTLTMPFGFHVPEKLSWSERLLGDYDNDGIVAIYDLVPLAQNYDFDPLPRTHPRQYARGRIYEPDATSGQYSSLWDKMNDMDWLDTGDVNTNAKILDTYCLFSSAPTGNLYDFSDKALTATKTALDGFWDGLVRDHFNWDSDNDGTPDNYRTFPVGLDFWGVPGDSQAIARHMGEQIHGYKVWVVPSDEASGFDPEDSQAPAPFATLQRGVDYAPVPGSLVRAVAQLNLTPQNLGIDPLTVEEESFDIFIIPYLVSPGDPPTFFFGEPTHIPSAVQINGEQFGPQYRGYTLGFRTQPLGSTFATFDHQQGLISASVFGQYLSLTHEDADRIDRLYRFISDENPAQSLNQEGGIRYTLYAVDPPDPTNGVGKLNLNDPQVVQDFFDSDNILLDWDEPATTLGPAGYWSIEHDLGAGPWLTAGSHDLDLDQEGNFVYFGIRASVPLQGGGFLEEYTFPGNISNPGFAIREVEIEVTYGPQYRLDNTVQPVYSGTAPVERGLISAQQLMETGFEMKSKDDPIYVEVEYYDADTVAKDQNNQPVWSSGFGGKSQVIYTLYGIPSSSQPTASSVFAVPLASWAEGETNGAVAVSDISGNDGTRTARVRIHPEDFCEDYWFGVRARNSADGFSEYLGTDGIGANENINANGVGIADFSPPVFVTTYNPANYLRADDPVNGLQSAASILNVTPLKSGFIVDFRAAFDPQPNVAVSTEDAITYTCYWAKGASIDPATEIWGGLAQRINVGLGRVVKVGAFDQPQSNPPSYLNILDGNSKPVTALDMVRFELQFDPGDVDLNASYSIYVAAKDTATSCSPSFSRNTDTWNGKLLNYQSPSGDLYNGSVANPMYFVGDIKADSANSYIIYGHGTGADTSRPAVSYMELPGGIFTGQNPFVRDLVPQGYHISSSEYSMSQAKLDFQYTQQGVIANDGNNPQHGAIVSFSAGSQGITPCYTTNLVNGVFTTPLQRNGQNLGFFWANGATAITTFQYLTSLISTNRETVYVLPWQGGGVSLGDGEIIPVGDLRYDVTGPLSTALTNNDWLYASGNPAPPRLDPSLQWNGLEQLKSGDIDSAQLSVSADALSPSAGFAMVGSISQTKPSPSQLFLLCNSSISWESTWPAEPWDYNPWKLLYSGRPHDITSWGRIDLNGTGAHGLPNLLPSSSGGPNAVAVKRIFDQSSPEGWHGHVYVAYSTSSFDNYAADGLGLRVASRRFAVNPDTAVLSWVEGWTDSALVTIQGDVFSMSADHQPRFDQVDLAVKPEAMNVSSTTQFGKWGGLGCLFINYATSSLLLAETVDGNTPGWQLATYNVFPESGKLDQGALYWAKLTYIPDGASSVPCIMYAVRTDFEEYAVRYWCPAQ